MANLTDNEKQALQAIDCSPYEESALSKAITLMAFIYTLIGYFIFNGVT